MITSAIQKSIHRHTKRHPATSTHRLPSRSKRAAKGRVHYELVAIDSRNTEVIQTADNLSGLLQGMDSSFLDPYSGKTVLEYSAGVCRPLTPQELKNAWQRVR